MIEKKIMAGIVYEINVPTYLEIYFLFGCMT